MDIVVKVIVCFFAGLGAGLGTGFAGMSAAAVISPMLIVLLGMSAYEAVGIALASDVLASAVSAYTYGKNKNLGAKWCCHDGDSADLHGNRKLCRKPCSQYNHGQFLCVYDLFAGHQVHCEAGDDHQGGYAECKPEEAADPVCCMWNSGRIYLRIYRSWWRHDDAFGSYQCVGL